MIAWLLKHIAPKPDYSWKERYKVKEKETEEFRPKLKFTPKDAKSLKRAASIMGVSVSGFIKIIIKGNMNPDDDSFQDKYCPTIASKMSENDKKEPMKVSRRTSKDRE